MALFSGNRLGLRLALGGRQVRFMVFRRRLGSVVDSRKQKWRSGAIQEHGMGITKACEMANHNATEREALDMLIGMLCTISTHMHMKTT